jgi:nitroreductase
MLDILFDTRRTVRLFLNDPVPEDDVDKIIAAAKKAPSKNCLYPYNIMALTNSEEGKKVKQHLCRNVCLCIWDIDKDAQYPAFDFDRNSITTPKIRMRQELKQIEAPLTLAFVGQWISDRNEKDNFFTTKDQMDKFTFENIVKNGNIELLTRVIRDCMLSCSWAQLKAQELGYDTAFVGIGGQHENSEVNKNGVVTLGDDENIIMLLCIGKEDKTRWEGVRCQETKRRVLNEEITEIHFYEKRRPGQAKFHGNPESKIITI